MKILIADDNIVLTNLLKDCIEKNTNFSNIIIANSSLEQMRIMEEEKPDLVITDNVRKNEEISGFDIILKYEKENPNIKFILITASPLILFINYETGKLPENIIAFLRKPFDFQQLINELKKID